MPEGHTIHRVAKDHTPLLVGRAVEVSSPQGRFGADASLVDGVVLERIEPYGKHLFYHWANGLVGHVHLGLFGKFRVTAGRDQPAPIGMVRMRMHTELATIDLAGPTDCSIGSADERDAVIARLGPDPLRRDARVSVAVERMGRSKQPIGAVLLDQKVMAGVGNVYRAEVLFVEGIHPARAACDCSSDELVAVWNTLTAMLRKGVKDNRIITIDRRAHPLPKGPARRGDSTYVYHRDRCLRCTTPVQTIELGGRPCYFCPTCQPR
ncbi:MAG: DNA-formamidopyrimidine glycosylase family protein [Actinomycetota bacterium]